MVLDLIKHWFHDVKSAGDPYPYTGVFATVHDGAPTQRTVTVRGFSGGGLVFFGDTRSPKGRHLELQPESALLFLSSVAGRQLTLRGNTTIARQTPEVAAYWSKQSDNHRAAALASHQSEVLLDRSELELAHEMARDLLHKHPETPAPDYYGAFVFDPRFVELWTADPHRMHERRRYARQSGGMWIEEDVWP